MKNLECSSGEEKSEQYLLRSLHSSEEPDDKPIKI